MAERSDVIEFLSLFKGCMMLDLFHVRDRDKNIQGLLDFEMDTTERKEVLLSLEPNNYAQGPVPDDMYNDKEVWIFGKEFNGKEIYIKLRLVQNSKNKDLFRAIVFSFHLAEHKLKYPLAN